jgi:hypothetical protein
VLGRASGRLYPRGLASFDYNAPAELFLSKRLRLRRSVTPLRTCARPKAFGSWPQVGAERFNSIEIESLYEALRKPE